MKSFFNESGALEPYYTPDPAESIDSPAQVIAETFGVPIDVSLRFCAWHDARIKAETETAVAKRTADIVAFLFQPCRNPRAKILGLLFSSELATRLNGVRNMSEQAKKDRVSRALISHYSRQWDRTFGYKISYAFGKSKEACEKYKQARIKYLETKKTT